MTETTKDQVISEEELEAEAEAKAESEEVNPDEEKAADEGEEAKEVSKEDEDMNTKYLRLMADFQNYKRRSEKQRSEIHAYANEKLATELLVVLDNFERALASETEGIEAFKEGMELIFVQLKDVLKASGLEEIEAYGIPFDPNFHNAVMMEDTDAVESGCVSLVLQKGYTLNGKVIRPSMVKVAN